MRRQFTIVAFSALLAVALAGAPVFARGGGGGGGGHGGGGGGRGGGGGHVGGGGGGFRGGGGGFRGGGGARGFSGGARSFSAPRMPSYGGSRGGSAMRAPGLGMARAPGYGAGGLSLTHASVGMGNRYGIGTRPAIGSLGNRANMGNFHSFGNTGFRGVTGAAGIAGGNRAVAFNRTNIVNRSSNLNAFRAGGFGGGLGYRGFGNGWRNPYYGFHQGWLGGFWGGYYPWGFGYGWGLGWGLGYGGYGLGYGGWGMWNWPYGSALYDYGYMPYSNAYYAPSAVVTGPYDYAQPIDPTLSPPPANTVTDDALSLFGSARDAFKQGSFESALQLADQALAKTPNDTALHEFRALCLFAVGRYDEAATTLYAILSVGPGWDWPTLISLYPGIDPYTTQLRALESYCVANPKSTAGRFVLAYHYLCDGHLDAATALLRQVVALKPDDTISAKLLQQLETAQPGGGAAPAPATAPAPAPANTTPPAGATIQGTWTAQPAPDTSITLTIRPDGTFQWQVHQKGKPQQFSGVSTFGGGVLTLAQEKGPVLVGRVSWKDSSHMTFHIVGGGPDDPGLSFSR